MRIRWMCLVGISLALLAASDPMTIRAAAPEYALSGRAGQLDLVMLADTPLGPVSALDLLMFDHQGERALVTIPMEVWLDPASLRADPYLDEIQSAIERLAGTYVVAQRAGAWAPTEDRLRVMSFGAAIATWIESDVKPHLQVTETDMERYWLAHPEKYLKRRAAEVRYIFKRVDNPDDSAARHVAEDELQLISREVRDGRLGFEEAARRESDAASSAQGGLIPPFYNGTYFTAFEDEAFRLEQPHQLSPVFDGPGGVYLVQLVRQWPARNVPLEEVADEIRERLSFDHVRSYYGYRRDKRLRDKLIQNPAGWWEYMNRDVPIARVGSAKLSRMDFFRYYENPTDSEFKIRWPVVLANAADWVEGESVMQMLEASGASTRQYRWIARARELATMRLRAKHVYAVEIPASVYATNELAVQSLTEDPAFAKLFRDVRLVRFEIIPRKDENARDPAFRPAIREARQLDQKLVEGTLATEPAPIDLAQWRASLVGEDGKDEFENALATLQALVKASEWTNVRVKVDDAGWQSVLPGSYWERMLAGTGVGEVSKPMDVVERRTRYLVVQQKPFDFEQMAQDPLQLREIAYWAAVWTIYADERDRIAGEGLIQHRY